MLFLDKATTTTLDFARRTVIMPGASPPPLVAAGGERDVSLCWLTPQPVIHRVTTPGKTGRVCPHPSKPLLALTNSETGRLTVIGFDGTTIFRQDAPALPAGSPEWMMAGYTDCRFDDRGNWLLCAARASEDHIEVQLRETEGWSIVDRIVVADPFGGSAASFHPTARPDTWALWLAAGQDGQCTCWLTRDGDSLGAAIESCLEDAIPPVSSPDGDAFLTIEVSGPLRRYRYPQVELLGSCDSPYGEDDLFGTSLCYLDSTRALAGSDNGRIAAVDTAAMRVVNEVIIEGHEPRPTEDYYYPQLVGDRRQCTDISYFERSENHLIVVWKLHHPMERRRPDGSVSIRFDEWRDGMLCFPVDYVLEQYPP
jgi:hypothetical protein